MNTNLIIRFNLSGFHCWEGAKKQSDPLKYLQHPHRHQFYWEVEISVRHANRAVEIVDFQGKLIERFRADYASSIHSESLDFGGMSCEQIAIETANIIDQETNPPIGTFREYIELHQPNAEFTLVSVQVLEDRENGAKFYV